MAISFAQQLMDFVSQLAPKQIVFISAADCTFFDLSVLKNTYDNPFEHIFRMVYYTTSKEVLNHIGESIASMNVFLHTSFHVVGRWRSERKRTLNAMWKTCE